MVETASVTVYFSHVGTEYYLAMYFFLIMEHTRRTASSHMSRIALLMLCCEHDLVLEIWNQYIFVDTHVRLYLNHSQQHNSFYSSLVPSLNSSKQWPHTNSLYYIQCRAILLRSILICVIGATQIESPFDCFIAILLQ